MKYEYEFATETAEFDEKRVRKLENLDRSEHNSQQTETRLHNTIGQKAIIVAKKATKNPNSSEVVLGKFNQDNISYIEVAQKRNATYFQLDDWDNVVNTIGENNIWKVNEQFIHEQLIQNKNFILSHNPFSATGYYKKEIEYLTKQGYQFTQNGDIWKALK